MEKANDVTQTLPEERELLKVRGACWRMSGIFGRRQVQGQIVLTDQRIIFRGGGLVDSLRLSFALPYTEIGVVWTCMISLFLPTGILLGCRDGQQICLSSWKRAAILPVLKERIEHFNGTGASEDSGGAESADGAEEPAAGEEPPAGGTSGN